MKELRFSHSDSVKIKPSLGLGFSVGTTSKVNNSYLD